MSEELQEAVSNSPEWYQASMTLEEVDQIIIANINTAKRSFIAIGFYLKYARDRQLYKDGGFSGVLEYARAKFGIGASQASKYMSINDKFSVNGNSPILLEKYQEFDKTQLSEMLYLTDEQLEQVSVGMTKVEIREIGSPEKVLEEPSFSPAKMEMGPEKNNCPIRERINENDKDGLKCSGGISEDCNSCDKFEPEESASVYPKLCKHVGKSNCVAVCDTGIDCCGECPESGQCNTECGWVDERVLKPNEAEPEPLKYFDKLAAYWCRRSMTAEMYELAASQEDEDIDVFNQYFKEKYVHTGFAPAYPAIQSHSIGYSMNDNGIIFKLDGKDMTYTWQVLKELVCQEAEHNTPASRPGNFHENSEGLKRLKEIRKEIRAKSNSTIQPEPGDIPLPETSPPEIVDNQPETVTDTEESEKCSKCNLNGNKDAGILECHPEKGEHKCWIDYSKYDSVVEQMEIVEADIIQKVPENPEQYTFQDVKDEHDKLTEYVDTFRRNNDTVPGRRKAKMRLDAIKLLSEEMQRPAVVEEPEPIQPELPILKNNDQRKEWLNKYQDWGVWYQDDNINARYYKYDFSDGSRIVVVEHMRKQYTSAGKYEDIFGSGQYHLIGGKDKYSAYVHDFFNPYPDNTSELVEHLKNVQRKKGA